MLIQAHNFKSDIPVIGFELSISFELSLNYQIP